MIEGFDTKRWALWRAPFDLLEAEVVRANRAQPNIASESAIEALRYVISFARLTEVTNPDGSKVNLVGALHRHSMLIRDRLQGEQKHADFLARVIAILPELIIMTRATRASLLENMGVDRASLEAEVTERKLVLALGGGGGAGYAYSGIFDLLQTHNVKPDLIVGTSIGSLLGAFRARDELFDISGTVDMANSLEWRSVFRVFDMRNKYGLPAALRLYLREVMDSQFMTEEGRPMRFTDMKIPLHVVVAGIKVDRLKHDLYYYEHLLDNGGGQLGRIGKRGILRVISSIREFLANPDALEEIVMGRDPDTLGFDVLDAVGFSSAVPGVIHYDILRDDPRTTRLLDDLYATRGITRMTEGGMISNVPARIAWESLASGRLGTRSGLVMAVDCFAPSVKTPLFYPLQKAVNVANVLADKEYAGLYLQTTRSISPINFVPKVTDLFKAMEYGRALLQPEVGFVRDMVREISVLGA